MPPISFPIKLWNVISSCPDDLLRWSADGRDVLVNKQRFHEVMERYPSLLRQPTLSCLRRLFAVYEFRCEDEDYEKTACWTRYSHPYFVRGQPDLLELFVLSHQTRRYNARRPSEDTEDGKPRNKRERRSSEDFTLKPDRPDVIDTEDDLQLIWSSSLFHQFSLASSLDIDGTAEQQFGSLQGQECSAPMITESEPPDLDTTSEVSFITDQKTAKQSNFETWMMQMSENDEWFGLSYQPLAVQVCCDLRQHESAHSFDSLQQMQLCNDMH